MLAAQLLGAGTSEGYLNQCGLAAVVERELGMQLDKTAQTAEWGGALTDDMLGYATRDAGVLLPLVDHLREALAASGLERVAMLEMRAVPAIAWLEQTGAPFDAEAWRALSDAAVEEQVRLEVELSELSGRRDLFGRSTLNWQAPEQIRRLLAERGHVIEHADEASLLGLLDVEPLAGPLLRYKDAAKRASTYGITFLREVNPDTSRIHAELPPASALPAGG